MGSAESLTDVALATAVVAIPEMLIFELSSIWLGLAGVGNQQPEFTYQVGVPFLGQSLA